MFGAILGLLANFHPEMLATMSFLMPEVFAPRKQGVLYGCVGFFCGIVGQGIANLIMTAKR